MKIHELRVWPSTERHRREDELAWQLAELATDPVPVDADVVEMLANRIIDNASVAIASLERPPVAHARQQALAHLRDGGATLFGLPPALPGIGGMGILGEWYGRPRTGLS